MGQLFYFVLFKNWNSGRKKSPATFYSRVTDTQKSLSAFFKNKSEKDCVCVWESVRVRVSDGVCVWERERERERNKETRTYKPTDKYIYMYVGIHIHWMHWRLRYLKIEGMGGRWKEGKRKKISEIETERETGREKKIKIYVPVLWTDICMYIYVCMYVDMCVEEKEMPKDWGEDMKGR
jgi:hypothetical protein